MQQLRTAVGTALVESHSPWLEAHFDVCSLDGRAILTTEDWWRVLREDALHRVEGSFAIAWKDSAGNISLARDPIGHRSIYYSLFRGKFAFSSTIKELLSNFELPRKINIRSVARYLSYAYIPGRDTIIDGVFEVLPGELVTFKSDNRAALERKAYWTLPSDPDVFASEDDLLPLLRSNLEDVVRSYLPSNSIAAASLSGGIDSSLVVAFAQLFSPEPIFTYSITFGPNYRDELPWSSLVAEHCKTRHTIVELTPSMIVNSLDHTIACFDKPNGDPLTVPNSLLFKTMAARSSVALNGEGGDPCFGGPKNVPMLLSTLYANSDSEEGLTCERDYLRAHLKCFDELSEMMTRDAYVAATSPPLESELLEWFGDPRWDGLVSKLMAINVRYKGGHHILPKVDALSAPYKILARSPLFSKRLVELAFSIPPQLKLKGSIEKYLLKRSVADLLPPAILDRPKSGMMVPVEGWFQGPLLPEAKARILDGLSKQAHSLFKRDYLEKLVSGKLGGLRPRRGVKIWLLITLESHLRALDVAYSS